MVTNSEGCDAHRGTLPLLRVCHEDDVVPVLPPFSIYELLTSAWMGVYEHFGQQLLLVRGKSGRACFLKGESEAQWWQHSFWLNLPLLSQPANHKMDVYVERLQRLDEGSACIVKYNRRMEEDILEDISEPNVEKQEEVSLPQEARTEVNAEGSPEATSWVSQSQLVVPTLVSKSQGRA